MKNILVTGGSGFIGSNFVNFLIEKGFKVINLDKLTYAGNEKNNQHLLSNDLYEFICGDINDEELVRDILKNKNIDYLVNFAAESHVDNSINTPEEFLKTNIMGTFKLLQEALIHSKRYKDFRFLHISTDEVYGSLKSNDLPFSESNKYSPNSPYSASKASSDHLVRAWHKTFGLNVITTNCSNNYGPKQNPEKLIPLTIMNAINGKKIPLYGDGSNIRDWLYVMDHCEGIYKTLLRGKTGEVYNIGGNNEKTNKYIVNKICSILDDVFPVKKNKNMPKRMNSYSELIENVKDRPGHDFRYSINSSKITKDLDWSPKETFESGIQKTISWYLSNQKWLDDVADS